MIQVTIRDGESPERLLRRFNDHVKSRGLPKKFRKLRNFKQKATKGQIRGMAIKREEYRAKRAKRQFAS